MPRDLNRNSSLVFFSVLILFLILAVAFAARAQVTGSVNPRLQSAVTYDSAVSTSDAVSATRVFRGPLVYDSGGGLGWTAAVADLNGDAKPDVVVVNYSGGYNGSPVGSVGVLLGKGNGNFQPAVTYDTGGGAPSGIVIGDLNGDGKRDLVVAEGCPRLGNNCLGVLFGNGDGTFKPAVTYDDGGFNWAASFKPVMIADLNADGHPDLMVVGGSDRSLNHGLLGILLGNGDGTFRPVVTYDSGGFSALSAALADVNGDGKVDVVIGNCTSSGSTDCFNKEAVVGVLLGNGDGTFQPVRRYGTGGVGGFSLPIVVQDVSGDGRPDILVGNYCPNNNCAARGSLGVLLGGDDGTFEPVVIYYPIRGPVTSMAVADLNGDGKLDVVVGAFLEMFLGNGDGSFQAATAIDLKKYPSQVFAADLNHDGHLDLVGINGTDGSADVFLGNADGTYRQPQNYNLGGSLFSWAALADIDADGKPDLVAASWCCQPFRNLEGAVGVLLNVSKSVTTTTVASSLNPSIYGQKVTWTAKVSTPGSFPPTGKVNFFGSGYYVGTAMLNASGVAALTKSAVNADPYGGPYSLVAVYSGDVMNSSSTSPVLSQDIFQTTSTASITSSQNPARQGQPVTFTARITSPTVVAAGPVTFFSGNTVLGTVQLGGGVARFTTSTLPVGSNRVKVTYYGNSNIASSSASLAQVVQ